MKPVTRLPHRVFVALLFLSGVFAELWVAGSLMTESALTAGAGERRLS